ncbi:hypothetical protein BDN70DRAFT_930729 [Pholiota conissans]|uniref:Uncharacterized protein n=1 Tax=Pholiota conissans TaxID=109636 RepID=A0A9P5Z5T4_9AGAR|nr:hypothetical protein BDN70DRAFT_930729 [Pholiota conissans]
MPTIVNPTLALPTELLHEIIDIVASDFSDKARLSKDLSSLALVSRTSRNHVNQHRFKEVKICNEDDIIHFFAFPQNAQNNPLSAYVRRLEIDIVDDTADSYLSRDNKMRQVLDNAFQYNEHPYKHPSLTFIWDVKYKPAKYGVKGPLSWKNLHSSVQSAFRKILQNPALSTLKVYSLGAVPRDLLQLCKATEYTFADVTFQTPSSHVEAEGILNPWQLHNITSFTTNHSTALVNYFGVNSTDRGNLEPPQFDQIQYLACCVCNDEEYNKTTELMQRAKATRYLSLTILEPMVLLKPLPYNYLEKLDCLCIEYYGALRPHNQKYSENVRNIVNPFLPSIPPVRTLKLCFTIFSTNNHNTELDRIFDYESHDFSPIEKFLAGSSPSTLDVIEIHIKVWATVRYAEEKLLENRLADEGPLYVQTMFFPNLAELATRSTDSTPTLQIYVKPYLTDEFEDEQLSGDPCYGLNTGFSILRKSE